MNDDDMIINLICLENGIVPFCGGRAGHIVKSLESLTPLERRRATRKFRKYLKKAIHQKAINHAPQCSDRFNWYKSQLREACGLKVVEGENSFWPDDVRKSPNKITTSQSNFRAALVRQYLRNNFKLDN